MEGATREGSAWTEVEWPQVYASTSVSDLSPKCLLILVLILRKLGFLWPGGTSLGNLESSQKLTGWAAWWLGAGLPTHPTPVPALCPARVREEPLANQGV